MLIIAFKGGAPYNPDWFHNVRANPRFGVEVGTETFSVDAHVLTREEHDEEWSAIVAEAPGVRWLRGQDGAHHPRGAVAPGSPNSAERR